MEELYLVKSVDKGKVEELLKTDDIVSRQSIIIRSASILEVEDDGFFILIKGSDESIKKADELLKDLAKKYPNKEKIIKKINEQEDSAMQGFGNILV